MVEKRPINLKVETLLVQLPGLTKSSIQSIYFTRTNFHQVYYLYHYFEAVYRGLILQSKEHTQNTRISTSELNSNSLTSKAQKQKLKKKSSIKKKTQKPMNYLIPTTKESPYKHTNMDEE